MTSFIRTLILSVKRLLCGCERLYVVKRLPQLGETYFTICPKCGARRDVIDIFDN